MDGPAGVPDPGAHRFWRDQPRRFVGEGACLFCPGRGHGGRCRGGDGHYGGSRPAGSLSGRCGTAALLTGCEDLPTSRPA
jgi:hypothetical protein